MFHATISQTLNRWNIRFLFEAQNKLLMKFVKQIVLFQQRSVKPRHYFTD